jgi:hypothetical protein
MSNDDHGYSKKCDWCHCFLLKTHETTVCDKCLPLVNSGYIRQCEACDSTITYIKKNGREQWNTHDGHRMCQKCWDKYVRGPVDTPISNKKYLASIMESHRRSINFRKKPVYFKVQPRKGICELCGAKKGDRFISARGRNSIVTTDIHHMEYHEDEPLRDTIELCDSCHLKETLTQARMNRQYYENQIMVVQS